MEKSNKERIWDLLRTVQNKRRGRINRYSRQCGLSLQEAILLREIVCKPGITTVELSQMLGMSKSTISSMINRLEGDGIVTREIPKNNRRITLLRISPEYGKRQDIIELRNDLVQSLFKELSEADADIIIKGLEKLNELMITDVEENL